MAAGDSADLRSAVLDVYDGIASDPGAEHPIPVGRPLAEGVGYPPELLDPVPPQSVEAFAGVTFVHGFAEIAAGSDVLDLGCGAGLDSLIAAPRASRVVGVDFAPTMLHRAREAARQARIPNVDFLQAAAESIPVAGASFDVVLVNGLFNLNPARTAIFAELARIVRPGGRVYAAEIILSGPLPEEDQFSTTNWFA